MLPELLPLLLRVLTAVAVTCSSQLWTYAVGGGTHSTGVKSRVLVEEQHPWLSVLCWVCSPLRKAPVKDARADVVTAGLPKCTGLLGAHVPMFMD
jgi:hypothetical protein